MEEFSISQSLESIKLSKITILLIDSSESIVDQDIHLLGLALASGNTVVLAANKADLLTAKEKDLVRTQVERKLRFADYIDTHFISAQENKGLIKLIKQSVQRHERNTKEVSTNKLNSILSDALVQQPPSMSGRFRPKIKVCSCRRKKPLRIVVHGNNLSSLQNTYKRYLENFFRKELDLSTSVFVQFMDSENPYKNKKNTLTDRKRKEEKELLKEESKLHNQRILLGFLLVCSCFISTTYGEDKLKKPNPEKFLSCIKHMVKRGLIIISG